MRSRHWGEMTFTQSGPAVERQPGPAGHVQVEHGPGQRLLPSQPPSVRPWGPQLHSQLEDATLNLEQPQIPSVSRARSQPERAQVPPRDEALPDGQSQAGRGRWSRPGRCRGVQGFLPGQRVSWADGRAAQRPLLGEPQAVRGPSQWTPLTGELIAVLSARGPHGATGLTHQPSLVGAGMTPASFAQEWSVGSRAVPSPCSVRPGGVLWLSGQCPAQVSAACKSQTDGPARRQTEPFLKAPSRPPPVSLQGLCPGCWARLGSLSLTAASGLAGWRSLPLWGLRQGLGVIPVDSSLTGLPPAQAGTCLGLWSSLPGAHSIRWLQGWGGALGDSPGRYPQGSFTSERPRVQPGLGKKREHGPRGDVLGLSRAAVAMVNIPGLLLGPPSDLQTWPQEA